MLLNKLVAISIALLLNACSSSHKTSGAKQTISKNDKEETSAKASAPDKTPVAVQTVSKNNKQEMSGSIDYSGKPTIIYKTSKDYKKNVPVVLSEDKTKIVSYPSPSDVFDNGNLAYPTELLNGYLLDNRGISLNAAFTKYTYEEYSKLNEAPDLKTLYNSIIDKNPFIEMYNCGNRYRFKDEVLELNDIIKKNSLSSFKKVK